jgi:hypothetical protein
LKRPRKKSAVTGPDFNAEDQKLALINDLDKKIAEKVKKAGTKARKKGSVSFGGKSGRRQVDWNKIAAYRRMGLSLQDIGDLVGISKEGVKQALKKMEIEKGEVDHFKEHRADILALFQKRILFSLTDEDIERIPPGSRMTAFGILYDKERIERGQSTSNQSQIQLVIQAYTDTVTLLEKLGEKPTIELPKQAMKVIEQKMKKDG